MTRYLITLFSLLYSFVLLNSCGESDAEFLEGKIFRIKEVRKENIIQLEAGYEIKLIGLNRSPKVAEYISQHLIGQEIRLLLDSKSRVDFSLYHSPFPVYMLVFDNSYCINARLLQEGYGGLDYDFLTDSLQAFSNYYHDSPMNQRRHSKETPKSGDKKLILTTEKIQKHVHRILTQYNGDKIGKNAGQLTQLCALWHHIYNHWYYIHDPKIRRDTWRSSEESVDYYYHNGSRYSGDCDDFAILTAAMARTIGFPSRFVSASSPTSGPGHAYAECFVPEAKWVLSKKEIRQYFGLSESKALKAKIGQYQGRKGYWVNLDWWVPHIAGPYYPGKRDMEQEDL